MFSFALSTSSREMTLLGSFIEVVALIFFCFQKNKQIHDSASSCCFSLFIVIVLNTNAISYGHLYFFYTFIEASTKERRSQLLVLILFPIQQFLFCIVLFSVNGSPRKLVHSSLENDCFLFLNLTYASFFLCL